VVDTVSAEGRSVPPDPQTPPPDPAALLRSARYLRLLVLAALLGVPISAAAYGFLALVGVLQDWLYTDLPRAVGMTTPPWWWPAPPLVLAGLLVGATIRFLPGRGGKSPADGFSESGPPPPSALPGIALAALAGLSAGAVIGPEAPLIALGGGLAAAALRLTRRAEQPTAAAVIGAAGSFAAVSTLLGSPLLGAFLLMEVSGLGGPMLGLVLLPGLLAAGVGSLIFIGLGAWTGLGTFSLAVPDIPGFAQPDLAQFGWAIAIGLIAAVLGTSIRWLALRVRPFVEPQPLVAVPLAGLVIAALAIGFAAATGHASSEVLFSGQDALGGLLTNSAGYPVGTLLLLIAAKGLAYTVSLAAFRGGPIFPAMFLGAALGMVLSHLPGLPLVAGAAMGIGAMSVVMLRLPLTSVLLASLLLASDELALMPLVIVTVVVAHVVTARLTPTPSTTTPVPDGAEQPADAPRDLRESDEAAARRRPG
jgi:H+/Cl- antiporter ClcA